LASARRNCLRTN